jgi:N-acylneuraminate cytidylyltransferase
MLAVIPARAGSRGLPGKNVRSFAGHPLIAHSLLCARACPEITRTVVSTDSAEIANVARQYGGEAPGLRPPELAADDTPLWPVLRHTLGAVEREEAQPYDLLALLDPTSPARLPSDISRAVAKLAAHPEADGVVAVSKPDFNPAWNCVVERGGWMCDFVTGAGAIARRQDAPAVYRINGVLYLWRADFVRRVESDWRARGNHVMLEIPETRALSIDDLDQFERAEALVGAGLIRLPWLG